MDLHYKEEGKTTLKGSDEEEDTVNYIYNKPGIMSELSALNPWTYHQSIVQATKKFCGDLMIT